MKKPKESQNHQKAQNHQEVRKREKAQFQPADTKDRNDLDPFEINFLPEFREGRGPEEPFVNEYGVVIGDYMYESPESPLQQWDEDTDPAIMSGDQWVHPFKDIGFQTEENRQYFEKGKPFKGGIFMHPVKDAAYEMNQESADGEAPRDELNEDSDQDLE